MCKKNNTEKKVFSQLEILCSKPGYIHTIAHFCFRDNTIGYNNRIEADDLLKMYSPDRLIRSEISTLIRLTCKNEINFNLPKPRIFNKNNKKTEQLLQKLHQAIYKSTLDFRNLSEPFATGETLREMIFYSCESAYNFQFHNFAVEKYKSDNSWFQENMGYSIDQANVIISAIFKIQSNKFNQIEKFFSKSQPSKWTVLPMYSFSVNEIFEITKLEKTVIKSFITSFVASKELLKSAYNSISDFNACNAYPIIPIDDENFILFQQYSLTEAFYETPFFWMFDDNKYKDIALKNRGDFTESFSQRRLETVFGKKRVFSNVSILHKKKIVGEIDVLVAFANRAIVIQAKSKKLTIEARKGNESSISNDFKKAVQDSYDQAFDCAEYLIDDKYKLVDSDGEELNISRDFDEIYPICIVSDNYPSLSIQVYNFLKYKITDNILPPFVMDIFTLDVLCEILQSPLYFLSYINRRVLYHTSILANHEIPVLGYHLKKNLWLSEDTDILQISDDWSTELDLAMQARRKNVPSETTPDGILTKYEHTFFKSLIHQIEQIDEPKIINLGFLLLQLNGETIESINHGVFKIIELCKVDKELHDLTLVFDKDPTGLTFHCNEANNPNALKNLTNHCLKRKNKHEAINWYGIGINANSQFELLLAF